MLIVLRRRPGALIGEQGSSLLTPPITILAGIFEHRVCPALLFFGGF